jgi:2-keto-3-deoxy-6-phosphogluconate aldolase
LVVAVGCLDQPQRKGRMMTKQSIRCGYLAAVVLAALVFGGCASTEEIVKHNEQLVAQGCPSIEVAAEEKCNSPEAIQEVKREQRDAVIQKEANEAEAVLRTRNAEELANLAEGK